MDFDHREGEVKVGNVAHAVARGWSLERTKAEIAKCDLVCAVCHRLRTHARRLGVERGALVGMSDVEEAARRVRDVVSGTRYDPVVASAPASIDPRRAAGEEF
jgi:hypothetical protein